jgi:aspartyl protease family protein
VGFTGSFLTRRKARGEKFSIFYYSVWLLPVLAGAAMMRREEWKKNAQYAAAWLAIIVVLVLGYAMKDTLLGELIPGRPRIDADGSLSVRASQGGHFYIKGAVNGAPVRFMVDTGASDIVLSPADATRAGFDPERLEKTRIYSTANGTVTGAPVKIGVLEVGQMHLNDVEASVNGAAMEHSLLGMSFLKRFQSYNVQGDTLTLVP